MTRRGYPTLAATVPSTGPDAEPAPAPWQANLHATCECLAWRGALDHLERRHAEDRLGETTYAAAPAPGRSAVVTAHLLIDRGVITEPELAGKMRAIRARFHSA